MKKSKNIFWGIIFILGAVILIVGRMGFGEGIGFWKILATLVIAGILVDGIRDRSYGRVLFPIAFLIIVYDDFLGLEAITPGPVLGAALLATIGLEFLFPQKKRGHNMNIIKDGKQNLFGENVLTDEEIQFSNTFGESVKYLSGKEISLVELENCFGSLSVFFDKAMLKGGEANVYVNNTFGSTVLYIPAEWKTIMSVDTAFGDVDEKGHSNPTGDIILRVHGKVSFGELKIHYL